MDICHSRFHLDSGNGSGKDRIKQNWEWYSQLNELKWSNIDQIVWYALRFKIWISLQIETVQKSLVLPLVTFSVPCPTPVLCAPIFPKPWNIASGVFPLCFPPWNHPTSHKCGVFQNVIYCVFCSLVWEREHCLLLLFNISI